MKQIIYSIKHYIQSDSFKTKTKTKTNHITSVFNQFLISSSKEEIKTSGHFLVKYEAFSHLKKKYFYN